MLRRVVTFLFASCLAAGAAGLDASKLPPPANVEIDFTRDIKPILDTSCIRCHGPERPRSKFRLDNRDDALKGGKDGVDIVPGHSEKSLLIFYVASLVEDMEMPPADKGEKLTAKQIGLLRAWIDQRVPWEETLPTNYSRAEISPIIGGTWVNGDNHKFREHYWRREGLDGGAENFELFYQTDKQTKGSLTGHVLRDDLDVNFNFDRNDFGFFRTGVQQYRKYYDDTGGYFPEIVRTPLSLDQDLHLNIGKAWADFGLTLPNWPRMVFGYEYDFKRGEEGTTSWNATPRGSPNIGPGSKFLDEAVHIVKFDLDADVNGVSIEDRFRAEFYTLNSHYTNADARGGSFENVSEGNHYFEGANSLRLEKKFTDWLFTSGGYFFSKLNGDASFSDTIVNIRGTTIATAPHITLERESHLLNLNGLFGSFDGLTISSGVQSEWTRQTGFGTGNLNQINSATPLATLPLLFTTLASDYDLSSFSETLALRYTKIPFTALFAEARAQQQSIGQSDSDVQTSQFLGTFAENPTYASQLTDLRFGFNTSPWRQVMWSAHYRRYEDDSWYEKRTIQEPIGGGYPGFIKSRALLTDEVETKLAIQPARWLKATLTYQYLITDYSSVTAPGPGLNPSSLPGLLAGRDQSHVYGFGMTVTPTRRLFLDGTFVYQPTSTTTADNGSPYINNYRGDVYSVIGTATYVISTNTDVFASYSYSKADYGQPLNTPALPLGIQYDQHALQVGLNHRFGPNLAAKIQYAFYHYNEPSAAGVNDYNAHSIFATLTLKLQ